MTVLDWIGLAVAGVMLVGLATMIVLAVVDVVGAVLHEGAKPNPRL